MLLELTFYLLIKLQAAQKMSNKISVLVNGSKFEIELISRSREQVKFFFEDREYLVEFEKEVPQKNTLKKTAATTHPQKTTALQKDGKLLILSPLPGFISSINVSRGQEIKIGDLLLQFEAMKMQNSIFAQTEGKIKNIFVSLGSEIKEGELLMEIET